MAVTRLATEEDIFDLLVLGRALSREAGPFYKFDPEKTQTVLKESLTNDQLQTFVLEDQGNVVGGIVCVLTTLPLGLAPLATELGMFIERDYRDKHGPWGMIKLLKEFEGWARKSGAKHLVISNILSMSDSKKLYERLGFNPIELNYTKEL